MAFTDNVFHEVEGLMRFWFSQSQREMEGGSKIRMKDGD